MGDLKKRLASGLVIGPLVVLLFVLLPPVPFLIFMGLVLVLAVYEWASMAGSRDRLIVAAFAAATLVLLYLAWPGLYLFWLLLSPALYLLWKIATDREGRRPLRAQGDGETMSVNERLGRFVVVLLLSETFICLSLFSFYRLKELDPYLPAILLLTIWASDTAAYLVGKNLGRHKLAPEVSPKKTIEGLLGAMAGAVVMSLLFSHRMGMTPLSAAGIGAAIGLLGQLGDMLESIAKRVYRVKDSSSLIPGHGGILDRIDSFLLTAPFLYYYLSGFLR